MHELEKLWAAGNAAYRDPAEVLGAGGHPVDPRLFKSRAEGAFWDILEESRQTLFVTREYEHLALALRREGSRNWVTYLQLPHPSGIAIDVKTQTAHIASTRNPNIIGSFKPLAGVTPRLDSRVSEIEGRPLMPFKSLFLPGSVYLHDLAMIGGTLYGNSVGQNAVIRIDESGAERAWWPHCIDMENGPVFGQNHIQLNSIAAGKTLQDSFFTASSEQVGHRRPGHRDYKVDRRGVVFSGKTREPSARGLTRPHSAVLRKGSVWVDNSGYGTLVIAEGDTPVEVSRLPGWTRGLTFWKDIALVGTSRVIPRYRQYAPGLNVDDSVCGIHAVNCHTGEKLGSLIWPYGYQIFSIQLAPTEMTTGFPFSAAPGQSAARKKDLFYSYVLSDPLHHSSEKIK